MTLQDMQYEVAVGDYVELFSAENGRKMFAGYVTEYGAIKFTLVAEKMSSGKVGQFEQNGRCEVTFSSERLIANLYKKHL